MLSLIIFNQRKYKNYVKVISNSLNLEFCYLLYKTGYILYYKRIENNKYLMIYLKYFNNQPILRKFKSYTNKTKPIFCKVKDLYSKYYTFNNYILLTSKGLLSVSQAKTKNLGGKLLVLIN